MGPQPQPQPQIQPIPAYVGRQEINDATTCVKQMGLKEALRRLEDAEPALWAEVVHSAVAATEPLRRTGMLDDIGGSIREDMLLALVVTAESVRLSHYRRWRDHGAREGPPPGLPLEMTPPLDDLHADPAMESATGPRQQSAWRCNMKRDGTVDADDILQAHLLVTSRGRTKSLRALEKAEPRLAGYVMEASSALSAQLARACDAPAAARRVERRVILLVLTCVEAVLRTRREDHRRGAHP